jgi:hypothetical protein
MSHRSDVEVFILATDCEEVPKRDGVVCQPPSQAVLGFRAANVTSDINGKGGNNREAWYIGQKLPL